MVSGDTLKHKVSSCLSSALLTSNMVLCGNNKKAVIRVGANSAAILALAIGSISRGKPKARQLVRH